MFNLFMYTLAGAIGLWLAVMMLAVVLMPLYFWLRARAD